MPKLYTFGNRLYRLYDNRVESPLCPLVALVPHLLRVVVKIRLQFAFMKGILTLWR